MPAWRGEGLEPRRRCWRWEEVCGAFVLFFYVLAALLNICFAVLLFCCFVAVVLCCIIPSLPLLTLSSITKSLSQVSLKPQDCIRNDPHAYHTELQQVFTRLRQQFLHHKQQQQCDSKWKGESDIEGGRVQRRAIVCVVCQIVTTRHASAAALCTQAHANAGTEGPLRACVQVLALGTALV